MPPSCSITAACRQVVPWSFGNVVKSLPPKWIEHSAPAQCSSMRSAGKPGQVQIELRNADLFALQLLD